MKNSKYAIWNKGHLHNAYVQKPPKTKVILLEATNAEERKIGLKYMAVHPRMD